MCVVSMVMDHYGDGWRRRFFPAVPVPMIPYTPPVVINPLRQEEIDEFRRLLERAREYDRRNSEPDCEAGEKRDLLKKMAEQLGVDISFVEEA